MIKFMSFEEYIEQHPELYSGTECDEATQGALLEWLFDYPISDESKFARYYRRRLNLLYPIYLKQVRLCSVLNNWDPFIVQYMEQLGSTGKTTDGKATTNKTTAGTTGTTNTTSRIIDATRTPELDYTTERDLAHSNHDITIAQGSDTTTGKTTEAATNENTGSTTVTKDLATADTGTVTNAGTETNTNTKDLTTTETNGGSDSRTTSQTTTENGTTTGSTSENSSETRNGDGKTLQYNMAYPETFSANLIMDADSYAEATVPVGAASSGVWNNRKENETTTGTRGTNTNDSRENERTTNGNESTSYGGTKTTRQTGTDAIEKDTNATETRNTTQTQTGTETTAETGKTEHEGETNTETSTTGLHNTEVTGSGTETGTETRTERGRETTRTSDTETGKTDTTTDSTETGETVNNTKDVIINKNIQQGRNESPADILPRAIATIQNSQPLKWLVDNLLVCFDTYDII